MSDAYLRRLVQATRDLAACDATVRDLLGSVDWGRCEEPEETDYETLNCLRQDFTPPLDDLFADRPICGACQANRETLKQVKAMRRKRYLAMLRVVRLSAHVDSRDSGRVA